jgi:hypothetical protein
MTWENDALRNDASDTIVYTGIVPEPETMNDTCRKTMLMGTVDRGFIAC